MENRSLVNWGRLAISAAAVTALLTLTACQPETPTDELKKKGKVSEQAEGETSWGGGEGPEYTPTPELPGSFPSSEVPLADGPVIDAGERSPGDWFANVSVPDDAATEAAVQKLTGAGFTIITDEAPGDDRQVVLQSPAYEVRMLAIGADGSITLSYEVKTRS